VTRCETVRKALSDSGILLLQDQKLPSIVGLFCDLKVSASWWSIPEAHDIFRCLESLEPTAVATRLINRKVTYVHRRLWPAIAAVGDTRQSWQMRGLSPDAKRLLAQTTRGESPIGHGPSARELQDRLLVVAHEVHTPSGKHEVRLQSWESWAATMDVVPLSSAEKARDILETAAVSIGGTRAMLPWPRS